MTPTQSSFGLRTGLRFSGSGCQARASSGLSGSSCYRVEPPDWRRGKSVKDAPVDDDVLWVDLRLIVDHKLAVCACSMLPVAQGAIVAAGPGFLHCIGVCRFDPEKLAANHAAKEHRTFPCKKPAGVFRGILITLAAGLGKIGSGAKHCACTLLLEGIWALYVPFKGIYIYIYIYIYP